jgi:general secretion pathway protein K
LVIVMVLVLAMAVMAGTFAYSMKVETRLAVNTRSGADLEWLGRSGIELARWVLQQQRGIPGEGMYDGLNQFWAGGVGPVESVDNPYSGVDLGQTRIGEGSVAVRIIDLDRKINLNTATQPVLEVAFQLLGAGAGDAGLIASAVLDWRDRDDLENAAGGAEKSYYGGLNPPYVPKNGPFDDISELLKVRGISPQLYWGARAGSRVPAATRDRHSRQPISLIPEDETGAGLVDVFTAISGGRVNVNTAPLPVLRILLGGDQTLAQQIVQRRAGPDGVEGTPDDQPFRNPAEIPGAGIVGGNAFTVQSTTFEIHVDASLGTAHKRFVGVFRRGVGREGVVMLFHPE